MAGEGFSVALELHSSPFILAPMTVEEEGDAEAEAVPDVEDESGDAGDVGDAGEQEEGEEGSAGVEQLAVPVKARIICSVGEEPLTVGKSLVPGGSPLHMEVPGAGTIVLTATLKPPEPPEPPEQPEPPADEIKCLCPTSVKRGAAAAADPQADDQLKTITTTMEQITSMQQVLLELKDKAQAMSDQLLGGGPGPAPMPMAAPPGLPYGAMPMPQPMPPPGFGGVPPGGREVFSAGGVGIYVVQKEASLMGGGMYGMPPPSPPPPPMQALPPPDFGQRDWGSPMVVTQSRGVEVYQSGGGGMCSGGGGQMMTCGGMSGCGGGRVACCGGVRISCCGGGMPLCCGQMNPCCGGGGGGCGSGGCGGGGCGGGGCGGGGPPQQVGGFPRAPEVEQQLALCQGDCTVPCDGAATPCVGRTR